ncbi:MAG: hypothetical protein NTY89_15840 [Nostocales cyanobacterium LacPavin_0920_SED1_MAG_38_18]|uniref:hypothetical protein n=1 Tax=Dolichospermum lemmermannii TaxID=54295 RepID=UPI00232BCE1D|nr:hypothetical protein [Dolichospermum lemmermannii]MCX5983228.1 hypothetical protein [Nostocales cyanobacterium LacPavin_0920_SED1_MAG_38_18]MDB9437323.1 hypothetical protein [Dolichospermum lemmermannii CS-548]
MSNNPEQGLFDFVFGVGKAIAGIAVTSEFKNDLNEEHHDPDHKNESFATQLGHAVGKTFIAIVDPFHPHHDSHHDQ